MEFHKAIYFNNTNKRSKKATRKCSVNILVCLALLVSFFLSMGAPAAADDVTVTGVYDYTSAYAMLELINSSRVAGGLHPLEFNYVLEDFAKQRAAEISVVNSHIRPDGSQTPYGENYSIGWGSAEAAHDGLMNSSSHYANIMSANYTSVAIASFVIDGRPIWVQVYSSGGDPGAPNGFSGSVSESRVVSVASSMDSEYYSNLDDTLILKVGSYTIIDTMVNGQMMQGTWSSDNTNVAVVDSSGKITGVGDGVCLITGNISGQTVRVQVTVQGGGGNPAGDTSVPAEEPAPVVEEPASVEETAPAEEPAPVVEEPAFVVEEPASIAEPVPIAESTSIVEETTSFASIEEPLAPSQEVTTGSAVGEASASYGEALNNFVEPSSDVLAGTDNAKTRSSSKSSSAPSPIQKLFGSVVDQAEKQLISLDKSRDKSNKLNTSTKSENSTKSEISTNSDPTDTSNISNKSTEHESALRSFITDGTISGPLRPILLGVSIMGIVLSGIAFFISLKSGK